MQAHFLGVLCCRAAQHLTHRSHQRYNKCISQICTSYWAHRNFCSVEQHYQGSMLGVKWGGWRVILEMLSAITSCTGNSGVRINIRGQVCLRKMWENWNCPSSTTYPKSILWHSILARHKFLIPNESRGGGGAKSKNIDNGSLIFIEWSECPHLILSGYPCGDSCDGGSGVEGNTYYCIIVVCRAGCWPRLCPVSGQSVCTCGTQQSPATLLSVYFSHSHNWSDLRCSSSSSLSSYCHRWGKWPNIGLHVMVCGGWMGDDCPQAVMCFIIFSSA